MLKLLRGCFPILIVSRFLRSLNDPMTIAGRHLLGWLMYWGSYAEWSLAGTATKSCILILNLTLTLTLTKLLTLMLNPNLKLRPKIYLLFSCIFTMQTILTLQLAHLVPQFPSINVNLHDTRESAIALYWPYCKSFILSPWTSRLTDMLTDPAMFTAVQTYVPASSGSALSMYRLPSLLRNVLPLSRS